MRSDTCLGCVDFDLIVPLSAQLCLDRWKSGKIGRAVMQHCVIPKQRHCSRYGARALEIFLRQGDSRKFYTQSSKIDLISLGNTPIKGNPTNVSNRLNNPVSSISGSVPSSLDSTSSHSSPPKMLLLPVMPPATIHLPLAKLVEAANATFSWNRTSPFHGNGTSVIGLQTFYNI